MIYRFRIILDNNNKDEDVFRDLEIKKNDSLEDFHNSIIQSFGFDGNEMASFYLCDEKWNQGDEISLFDLNEGDTNNKLMCNVLLEDILNKDNRKLIYVYDFLNMWTFLVELADIVEESNNTIYPNLIFINGQIPSDVPEKSFTAYNINNDDLDHEDYDNFYN